MARVRLSNLTKTYAGRKGAAVTAVKGIDLDIAEREFMVLVGPSGCGKSTTLRMIAGLESISAGTVSIDGSIVNEVEPKDRAIAMVFQNYALYPHMTVFQNMAFGLKLSGLPKADIQKRVGEAAGALGLEELLERKPKALSGGQRQRVALGRAMVRQPKVFLFDEPLSNLDAKMRVSMRAEIARLHQRLGATMIYVTHDQEEAMTLGDRICVMRDGEIMQVASPMELYDRPANRFVADFVGSPSMNFLEGRLRGAGDRMVFETADGFQLAVDSRWQAEEGRSVLLGVRPESLRIEIADASRATHATVSLIEPLGSSTIVYARRPSGEELRAKVSPQERFEVGQGIALSIAPDDARFFDAASGDRLG